VSDSWVRKIRLRLANLGDVTPGTPPGKPRKLTEKREEKLCLLSLEHPDATLAELADLAKRRMAISLSISTPSRRLIEMGRTRKKSLHATEAERPDVARQRESFHEQDDLQEPGRLIFLDETGIQLGMARAYARAVSVPWMPFRLTGATTSPSPPV
jgi:transposase